MKRSTKITSAVIIFFLIIASVIIARTMIGNHFQKKFGKRPPPGIIVTQVIEKQFEDVVETFGTAIPIQTKSYNIEKFEILNPLNYNQKINKGEIVAELKTRTIIAPFDGVISKRNFSDDLEVSKTSILINFEDTSTIFTDVNIPELFAPFIKEGLPVEIKFSGYKDKVYEGIVDSVASRINTDNRSLAARIKMNNSNLDILPGALLELSIKYNVRNSLGIPDTAALVEGDNVYLYIVGEDNKVKKTQIKTGLRKKGFLEVNEGVGLGDKIVAEGLKKVRPNAEIKPIEKK